MEALSHLSIPTALLNRAAPTILASIRTLLRYTTHPGGGRRGEERGWRWWKSWSWGEHGQGPDQVQVQDLEWENWGEEQVKGGGSGVRLCG